MTSKNNPRLVGRSALLVILGFACVASLMADERPNILVIVADDLGYADLGQTGSRDIPTPHIDSIAHRGVSFTNAYVTASVCLPSRHGLMTGRYQQRFGVQTLDGPKYKGKAGLPASEQTLGQRLKRAGYRTGIVGKWHLGEPAEYHPNLRGFDEFYGFTGGSISYFPDGKNDLMRDRESVPKPEYVTDAFGDEAVDFIHRHQAGRFFLYLSFSAVHDPMQASQKYLDRFKHIEDPGRRVYAAMTAALDDNVGRVLAALRRHNLTESTLVVFLSDNGGAPQNWSENTPYRGGKYELYEGGIRTPFFLQWPGGGISAGQRRDSLVSALDIVPTVLSAAGIVTAPTDELDGVNLIPLLKGTQQALPRQRLYWRYGPYMCAMREGDWKLLKNGVGEDQNPRWQLYDLGRDPGEARDLADANPDRVVEMAAVFAAWDDTLPVARFIDQRLMDGIIWWRTRAPLPQDQQD